MKYPDVWAQSAIAETVSEELERALRDQNHGNPAADVLLKRAYRASASLAATLHALEKLLETK